MSTKPRIRLGMVGGGEGAFIGALHRMSARLDDNFELVAGCFSSDPERNLRSGLALHVAPDRCYSNWLAMANAESSRPDGIDVVVIVTPNHLHVPVSLAFVEAGIDVLCDKPVARTLAEAQPLVDAVARHHVTFAATYNYSAYPMVQQARELVADGALGTIKVVQVEYAQDWLAQNLAGSGNKQASWRDDPSQAGPAGALGDIGSHAIDLATFISGLQVEQVSAELSTLVEGRRLDDNVQVMLRFAGGARGALWASQVAIGQANALRIRVFGDLGALAFDQEQPDLLWYTPQGKPTQRLERGRDYLGNEAQALARLPSGHPEGYLEALGNLYRAYAQRRQGLVNHEAPLLPNLARGMQGLAFIDAVLKSAAANGKWHHVPVFHAGD